MLTLDAMFEPGIAGGHLGKAECESIGVQNGWATFALSSLWAKESA